MAERQRYNFYRMQQEFDAALAGINHDLSAAREEGDCDWLSGLIDDTFSVDNRALEVAVFNQINAAVKNKEYETVEFMVYKCLERGKAQSVSLIMENIIRNEEFNALPYVVAPILAEGDSKLVIDQFPQFLNDVQSKTMSVDACSKVCSIFYLSSLENDLPSDLSKNIWNEIDYLFSNDRRGEISQDILVSLDMEGDASNYDKALSDMNISAKPDLIAAAAPQ